MNTGMDLDDFSVEGVSKEWRQLYIIAYISS